MVRMGRVALSLAVLAAVMLSLASVPMDAPPTTGDTPGEGDDTPQEITVYGYVANMSNEGGNVPMSGVTVTLYLGQGASSQSDVTDTDGRFEFTYTETETTALTVEADGFTVRGLPSNMQFASNPSGISTILFTVDDSMRDSEGMYCITGSIGSGHAIAMAITNEEFYGYVYGTDGDGDFALAGATVTVTSTDTDRSYSASTNDRGYFYIECLQGTYTISVSCTGFTTSEPVEAVSGSANYITLRQNSSEIMFGLDAPHTMLLIGLALLAIVFVVSMFVLRKSKEPDSGIVVINDVDDIVEEESEVKRP